MANELDLAPESFVSPILDEVGVPGAAAGQAPKTEGYKPLFRHSENRLDPDIDGSKTEAIGASLNLPYTKDTVAELNLFGEVVSADDLRKLDGGEALLDLARRKRTGQRTFSEALFSGSATDFIPYAGDIASTGIAIKNMKVVRDALRKVTESGSFDALSTQEKVLTKLYMEDMERQANQTFGGQVGSIIRQAPAFALEFLSTGAVGKLVSTPIKAAVKKTATEIVERGVKSQLTKLAAEKLATTGMTREALSLTDDVAKIADDVFSNAIKTGATEAEATALKGAATKAGEAYEFAVKNPNRFKNVVEFLGEYGKRGVFDHMDDVVRDLPPTVAGKLREAAGVAFIEAPVKGLLYSSFDFLVANPLITRAAGGTEAVTRTELGLHLTGDKEVMDNAKMLAFGSAWAEYASESSGRAFNAIGGLVTDNLAGSVGRRLARSGLRAREDYVKDGSVAKRLFNYTVGTEAQLKAGMQAIRNEAVESAVKNGSPLVAGKDVAQVLADKDLTEKVMKGYLGFRDKSFLGYWVANKALEKNLTPQAVTRMLESMGYDDILGEFMEERYSGFAEGLFGLDGQEHKSNLERIAHAFKSATPDVKQAGAEILAFSVPVMARAATSKAYEFLGQGTLGKLSRAGEAIDALKNTPGLIINREGTQIKHIDIAKSDANSGSIASEFTAKAGRIDSGTIETLNVGVDALVDAIPAYSAAREDKLGFGVGVARAILGTANAIITGNPLMAFHNPMKALARQSIGEGGARLLNAVHTAHRNLYKAELDRRSAKSAEGIETDTASGIPEGAFDSPEIMDAIRPDLRKVTRFLLKEHLRTSGTVIVEDEDVDSFLDAKFKGSAIGGKLAGLSREEFREKFYDELAGGAAGRLTMDVVDEEVHTTYRRPEAVLEDTTFGHMARAVEEFFATQHIATHIDASTTTDIRKSIEASTGTPIDVDQLVLARGDGMPKGSKEVEQARLALVMKMFPNPNLATQWDLYMSYAARTASVLLEAHSGFLRPSFEIAGVPVAIKDADGGFILAEVDKSDKLDGTSVYATLDEAAAAAGAMPGAVRGRARINFTPSNTTVLPYASMLLSGDTGSRGYMLKNRSYDTSSNPFHPDSKLSHAEAKKIVDEEIRLGTAYLNRFNTPFANKQDEAAAKVAYDRALADTSRGDTVDGYETVMRKVAEAAGIKRFGTPDRRGERSYIFEPAALSIGDTVYVSYARMSSHAAIIEDALEVAIKRNPSIFQDPADRQKNSPVVQAMMRTIQPLLRELSESQDTSVTAQTKDEAKYLSDLLDPESFEVEAISHVATAIVFMQGDNARIHSSGSRLYGTLGLISKRVRSDTQTYDAFVSLINRAVSGTMLTDKGGAVASMVRAFADPSLRDSSTALRDTVSGESLYTPANDTMRAGADLATEVKVALSGTPRSGFISPYGSEAQKHEQAIYKQEIERLRSSAVKGGRVYFDEELPFVLEQVKGTFNDRLREAGRNIILPEAEEGAPTPQEAAVAAAEEYVIEESDDSYPDDEDVGASWAADILDRHPAFAIKQADIWNSAEGGYGTDTRTHFNKVFDAWQRKDPTLGDYHRQRFFEKAKEAGLIVESSGKQNDLTESIDTSEPDPLSTVELDETDDPAETQGAVDEHDASDEPAPTGTDNSFNQDAVARNLENDAHVQIIRGIMHSNLPAAQRNDQEALRMLVEASATLYPKGMGDTTSIASLFNEATWTSGVLHPALVDEDSFAEWLDMSRPENGDPLFDDLISAMRIIGLAGTFTAADKMKGSYVKSVFELRATVDADGKHVGVEFNPRTQSLSADLIESLLRAAKTAKPSGEDIKAAVSLLEAEATQGLGGRLGRLASAAALLFGKHNALSQSLLKNKVRAFISNKVVALRDSIYVTHFESYESKAVKAPAGLLAYRLLNTAKLMEAGNHAGAIRQLIRGDSLDLGQADNRGGVSYILNDLASLVPVSSANRIGLNGGKTRAIDSAMSAGQKSLLLSDEFLTAFTQYGGDAAGLPYAQRFGEWADGTPVFAALSGLRRTTVEDEGDFDTPAVTGASEKVPNPQYDEVSDLAILEYERGESQNVHVVVYNSEKDLERIVTIPRSVVPAFTKTAAPTYAELLKAVSRLMRIAELSPKRGAHHMAAGAAAELQNAELAILLTDDEKARENLHGMGYIGDADLAGYYRRQGFGSAAKVVLTESPTSGQYAFFAKGQFILADQEPPKGALHPAAEEIHKVARDYAYLSDKDSFKETALYYKTSDGSTVLDKLLAGDSEGDAILPNGTTVKVADLTTAIGAKVASVTVNGSPATVVSIRMGLRSQWASAPAKKANPKFSEVPVNYVMDNPEMWSALNAQVDVMYALKRRTEAADVVNTVDSLPDSHRTLVAAGVDRRDPNIMQQLGPKLASAATKPFRPVFFGLKYLNRNFNGARVVESAPGVPVIENGKPKISDPFGGMDVLPGGLIHDAYDLTAEEAAGMGGAKKRLASTCANIGGATARYGMRIDSTKLGIDETNHDGIMEAIETRILLLRAAELRSRAENDPTIYLRAYKANVEGVFMDFEGNPLMPGQLMTFSDLINDDGTFDKTSLYSVNEKGNSFVFLNGQLEISGRTPSRDGKRAEYPHRVAAPAEMVESDGTQMYTAVAVGRDGALRSIKMRYPAGTMIPGPDAILMLTPFAKYIAGSDDDWDTSSSQRLPVDALGREFLGVEGAEKLITEAENDEAAKAVARQAVSGLAAQGFRSAIAAHRVAPMLMTPVVATPFSPAYQKNGIPAKPTPKLDTPEAMDYARQNKEASNSRGISVAVVGSLEAALDVGMVFTKEVREPVLDRPEGAKSRYWIDGFKIGSRPVWTTARKDEFIRIATGIANSTFDDLKEALAARAGFRPEFLDLYLFLGFESGVTTRAEYEEFHTAFMEWMNGPDGKSVTKAYRNELNPSRNGGTRFANRISDTIREINRLAMAEADEAAQNGNTHYLFRMFRHLPAAHQRVISSLVINRGDSVKYGYLAVMPAVQAFYRIRKITAVGNVLAYKKAKLTSPSLIITFNGRIDTVVNMMNQSGKDVQFSPAGRNAISEAVSAASRMATGATKALSGLPDWSTVCATAVTHGYAGKNDRRKAGGIPASDAVRLAVNTRLPFEAAVMMTPADTGAKIDTLRKAAARGRETSEFLAAVETVLKGMYKSYAGMKGTPNAAMDSLLAPSKQNKASRITMTGSDGTDASSGAIQAAMEAMRDWTEADKSLPVEVLNIGGTGLRITPADFYWMLLQYCCLTQEKTVDTGRVAQSLLRAFYGSEVYRRISDYQIAVLDNRDQSGKDPKRLLKFSESLLTDYKGLAVRKRVVFGIPDAMASGEKLEWGTYDTWYRNTYKATEGTVAEPKTTVAPEAPEVKPVVADMPVAPEEIVQPVVAGVKLPVTSAYTAKDQLKADKATKFIGRGSPSSSTAAYSKAFGVSSNPGKYAAGDVVFVSAEGARTGRLDPDFAEIQKAVDAKATILTDDSANRSRTYNVGERQVAEYLGKAGYSESAPGVWTPSVQPAPQVNHTVESAAWKNAREYAKTVAGMTKASSARRLGEYAKYGLEEAGRMTDGAATRASVMAKTLTDMSSIPWVKPIPGAKETLDAAGNILRVMRYPEPAVFIGAVRAIGRTVASARIKDAMDPMVELFKLSGAAQSGDAGRIGKLTGEESADALSAPANLRVMMFAVASEASLSKGPLAAVPTKELAKDILGKLDMDVGITASMATDVSLDTPLQVASRVAIKEHNFVPGTFKYGEYLREWRPYAVEANRIVSRTGNLTAAMAQVPANADDEFVRRLYDALLRKHRKIVAQADEAYAPRAPVTDAAMWEQSTGVVAYPEDAMDAEDKAEAAAMVDHAVGYTDGRKATYVQPELDLSRKPEVNASVADDVIDMVRRADAEISGLSFDRDELLSYMEQAHPGKANEFLRKSVYPDDSLAARMPLFLASDPDARKLLFGYITGTIKELEGMKGLGNSRRDMAVSLGMLFQPNTDRKVWKAVEHMNGKAFEELMKQLGNTETGTLGRLLELRKNAEKLEGADRDRVVAEIDKAEGLYLSAMHLGRTAAVALRPQVNGAVNPLRAQIGAIEARVTPPEGAGPLPETPIEEVPLVDPDTGHPDPIDDFNVTFVDSDAWFYGTVFPDFRGTDIRKILFDKEALAAVPQAFAAANRFDAYLGIDSDTGSFRKITRQKGMGHHLADGGYTYDAASAADITKFGRRKMVREQADILSGRAHSDDEFALARWWGGAVYAYMGDGGIDARQATAGEIKFDLPWSIETDKLEALVSVEEAVRRVGKTGTERPFAIHELLLRARESLPKEILPFAVDALKRAVHAGALSKGDFAAKSQAALKYLRDSGYAVARERTIVGTGGNKATTLYDVRLAIPVRVTDAVFQASSAKDKLVVHGGRLAEELTLEANAKLLKEAFDKVDVSARSLGWVSDGDARMFSDIGSPVPFFKGTGAYQYYARRLTKPPTPAYKDAVTKAYESLKDTFAKMKVTDRTGTRYITGEEASQSDRYQRMFGLLRDLHPQTFGDVSDSAGTWNVIASGRASNLGLNAESTAWDIAKEIYTASVSKLHESAWLGGTVKSMDITTAGLEAFNRAISEAAAEQNVDLGSMGATFSEIYRVSGALPQNLTAGEALALHARQVAEMTRYRMTLNQLLMTADEDGMPLIYAKPGLNVNDDTVPDMMWGMLARWWAETGSDSLGRTVAYDSTLSGRDNASRIFDEVTRGKDATGSEQEVAGGIRRYILSNVEVPPGMETFSSVKAMKDRVGDDTKARMNAFGGGEAANIARQVFAIAGYGRDDTKLAGMNRALSWSKSASVMASLFFPIATAFESPVAAVGFWSTTFGLTNPGANAARWLSENQGWLAKAFGVNDVAKAPFMADILRVIGSDDPALIDLKVHATLAGLSLADRAKNMMDTDRTIIAKDIAAVTAQVRATMGAKAAKSAKALLEGAMEHSSEFAFEYVINATKLAVFAQMNERLRQKAISAGRWWDPVRDMRKWANYINSEVGGIDTAMYPWMTPKMQRVLKALMFSWEWTLGAWEAGGGGVITQKWFGSTTPAHIRKFMFGRWVRMYGSVMIGLPVAMQLIITGIAKAAGEGDDDDKWFSWQNEKGREGKDFDITPLLRWIANSRPIPFIGPTWGEIKKREIPVISALIPALTGQEGDNPTTRKRRYYMHLGKQGWEVAGWFENPTKSFLSKMSMPAQKILEGVLGITPSMGWETPFAEMGFWERWTSLNPEKSALVNLGSAFLPFSVMGAQRTPEIGALAAVGPIGKGMSKTRAEKEMAKMFMEWGDAESYAAMRKGRPGAWTDLNSMAVEWLEALRLNGYPPETSLKNALAAARKPLYERVHNALPAFKGGKADVRELEAAARGLHRLNYVGRNLSKSIKARDKSQHIKRVKELDTITDEVMRDAFMHPYGPTPDNRLKQSAAGGGDVRKLLAGDKMPKTVLGYKVLRTEELSESDKAFFRDNPESPGFFDKAAKEAK